MDRDYFVLLDAYLVTVSKNGVFLVDSFPGTPLYCLMNCTRTIIRRFWLLDGEGQCYFG